ncbi:hypothetical protein IGI04_026295 [Brassica rapa subsp. trilocularis]|uniref:Uncharacterized protein n=1 Tax=Brassica rapa subsp. trilocularis TaxID=1813537 RepID=A0ABQ7KVV9_BRACM|nr:hypothetical protein IGI04_026295 [Brassica rapa subsp. trilocularis]
MNFNVSPPIALNLMFADPQLQSIEIPLLAKASDPNEGQLNTSSFTSLFTASSSALSTFGAIEIRFVNKILHYDEVSEQALICHTRANLSSLPLSAHCLS